MSVKLKGYLYVLVKNVTGLPVLGKGKDRADSYVAVYLDDMEEASTDVVYDSENAVFDKKLKIKVKGHYSDFSLQVLPGEPRDDAPEHYGEVQVPLKSILSGEAVQVNEKLQFRDENATGDASKDRVQGKLSVVVQYKEYKKKASAAERRKQAEEAAKKREAEEKARLEKARVELAARQAHEKKLAEQREAARLAQIRKMEAEARERAEALEIARAKRAAIERAKRAERERLALEERARRERAEAERIRRAKEAERKAFAERQRRLLEQQRKSKDAKDAELAKKLMAEAEDDAAFDEADDEDNELNDILAPARGRMTAEYFSKQTAPTKKINGTICNISAGHDGYIYGADTDEKIYERNDKGVWRRIPGRAICLAAATDGTVYCVNSTQKIYTLKANGRSWRRMPGAMQWLDVGRADLVWGVDIEGKPHQYDAARRSWEQRPGHNFAKISVGDDGEVWAVSRDQHAFRWTGRSWTQVPGMIKSVAVQNKHCVWAVHVLGGVYAWQGNVWTKLANGDKLHGVAVSKEGAFGFDAQNKVYFAPAPVAVNSDVTAVSSLRAHGEFVPNWACDNNQHSFFWSEDPPRTGDTFDVMPSKMIVCKSVTIHAGKAAGIGGQDAPLRDVDLQISFDGMTFIPVGKVENNKAEATYNVMPLPVKVFRLKWTRNQRDVVAIREVVFTPFGQ